MGRQLHRSNREEEFEHSSKFNDLTAIGNLDSATDPIGYHTNSNWLFDFFIPYRYVLIRRTAMVPFVAIIGDGMGNVLDELSEGAKWRLMVEAAKRGAKKDGYEMNRLPGRGLSNVWEMKKAGVTLVTSIRTTRDRWIAFPPLAGGTRWKTLDDVQRVLVATVDSKDDPRDVSVYMFDAGEVRERFNASYAARIGGGHVVRDNYGMWVALDQKPAGNPSNVGSGLADKYKPIAVYSISSLIESGAGGEAWDSDIAVPPEEAAGLEPDEPPLTIADAKRRLARAFGVDPANIKIIVEA